jgi:hypothetical protein
MKAMRLLVEVLKMETADEIHEFMQRSLIEAGLGRVIPSHQGLDTK